jgi:uncharacterized membrane protein YfhO
MLYINKLLILLDGKDNNYFNKISYKVIDNKIEIDNEDNNKEIYIITKELIKKDQKEKNIYSYVASDETDGWIIKNSSNKKIILEFDKNIDESKIDGVYSLNYDKLVQFKNNRDEMTITKKDNSSFEATVDAREDSVLMITLPYEEGWTVYLDGKKVDYFEVIDSFIGIDITKGSHIIKMEYKIPGLELGLGISLVSITILIVYELNRKRIS